MLVIPKVLAQNSGFDSQDVMVKLLEESATGQVVSYHKIPFFLSVAKLSEMLF